VTVPSYMLSVVVAVAVAVAVVTRNRQSNAMLACPARSAWAWQAGCSG
jgi:hypothetical protein